MPAKASSLVRSWELQNSTTKAGLRGIHAVGGGIAWASGTDGTVLRTEDGGYMWQSCAMPPGAEKLDFRGIWAWDANTAIVMSSGPGDLSRLYKTTNGCSSWKLLFTNPDAGAKKGFWDALIFADLKDGRKVGLVIGDPVEKNPVLPVEGGDSSFRMRLTNDGGSTWIPIVAPAVEPGHGLHPFAGESLFAASNAAVAIQGGWLWFGTSKDRVLRIQVNGTYPAACEGAVDPISLSCGLPWIGWQAAALPLASGSDSSGVFSLAFRDQNVGIAVGGDYKKLNEIRGTAAYTSDGGKTWTAAAKPPHGYRSAVAWNPGSKSQPGYWIAAGTNGSDISYDDGKTWKPLDDGNWNALSLPWVVGPEGRIAKLVSLKPAETASR